MEDDDYARLASMQKDASCNIITASLKADENCFRRSGTDVLKKLYEEVKAYTTAKGIPFIEASNQAIPQN